MNEIVVIDPAGDVLLRILDSVKDTTPVFIEYRVNAAKLRASSRYFKRILDPASGFLEQDVLRNPSSEDLAAASASALPRISIEESVPSTSAGTSNSDAVTAFFQILNGKASLYGLKEKSIGFIALVVALADRFEAVEAISDNIAAGSSSKPYNGLTYTKLNLLAERVARQRIYVGNLMNFQTWVLPATRLLVEHGSVHWTAERTAEERAMIALEDTAPWNDLPGDIEEELLARRHYILATIDSLIESYIEKYSSRTQQCKLGYGNSPACDSFQLGEMIRFFRRKGSLTVTSNLSGQDDKPARTGSLTNIFKALKEYRPYQIDTNHTNCGIRSSFIPRLETVEVLVSTNERIGICLPCWKSNKAIISWVKNPYKGTWNYSNTVPIQAPIVRDVTASTSYAEKHSQPKERIGFLKTPGKVY